MSGISFKIITEEDVFEIFKGRIDTAFSIVEEALRKYNNNEVLFPDKISQIFDEKTQNRINCMPSTLLSDKVSGLKWVSVFPTNAGKQIQNVTGVVLLSEIETGFPIAVIDATFMTRLRTAAVGCVAAKYLAPSKVNTIGFIGAGEEAKMHFVLLKHMFPEINECRVSSRKEETERSFINSFKNFEDDVNFISCNGDNSKSVQNADIIITAISGQAPVLKAKDILKGSLYIHVGGWEDEYDVALKADKIVCDDWESSKHRTQTICRMYKEGLLKDDDIYANLYELTSGLKKGRDSDGEFIYFNSVGLSFIDLNFALHIYEESIKKNLGSFHVLSNSTGFDYKSLI